MPLTKPSRRADDRPGNGRRAVRARIVRSAVLSDARPRGWRNADRHAARRPARGRRAVAPGHHWIRSRRFRLAASALFRGYGLGGARVWRMGWAVRSDVANGVNGNALDDSDPRRHEVPISFGLSYSQALCWAWPTARCALLPQRRRRQRRAAQAVGAHEHVREGLRRTSKRTRASRVPVAGDAPRCRYGQTQCSRQAFRRSRRRRAECRAARTQYCLDPCHEHGADLSLHWLRARDLFPCPLDAHIGPGVSRRLPGALLSASSACTGRPAACSGWISCRSRSRNAPTSERQHSWRSSPPRESPSS